MFWVSPKDPYPLVLELNTSLMKSSVNTSKIVVKVNGETVTPSYGRINLDTITQNIVITIYEQA